MSKVLCQSCAWFGLSSEALEARSPFDQAEKILGCPACKAIDDFLQCCDEPGCDQPASCGTPTPQGYRHTCGRHQPD